jgi:hypothetical protein
MSFYLQELQTTKSMLDQLESMRLLVAAT